MLFLGCDGGAGVDFDFDFEGVDAQIFRDFFCCTEYFLCFLPVYCVLPLYKVSHHQYPVAQYRRDGERHSWSIITQRLHLALEGFEDLLQALILNAALRLATGLEIFVRPSTTRHTAPGRGGITGRGSPSPSASPRSLTFSISIPRDVRQPRRVKRHRPTRPPTRSCDPGRIVSERLQRTGREGRRQHERQSQDINHRVRRWRVRKVVHHIALGA